MDRVVEMRRIAKSYDGNVIFDKIDFTLQKGSIHVIAGINGSGKSTLAKILSGQLDFETGDILINGQLAKYTDLKSAREKGIGIMHQEYMLIPDLTVAENVLFGAGEYTPNRKRMYSKATPVLEALGIDLDPSMKVNELDVESQILLEFAVAVYSNPEVLIVDDPFSLVGSSYRKKLLKIIEDLNNKGMSFILTTVDPQIMIYGDELSIIDERILIRQSSSPRECDLPESFQFSHQSSITGVAESPFMIVDNLARSGITLSLSKGDVLCLSCEDSEVVRLLTQSISRQDPFRDNAIPMVQEAKSFFDSFLGKSSRSQSAKYFRSMCKNTGFVLQQMLQKKSVFRSRIRVKKNASSNREQVMSIKEFLASLDFTNGFSKLIDEEDRKLAKMRYDACDFFVFVEPTVGLDPLSIKALGEVFCDISDKLKTAVVIGREENLKWLPFSAVQRLIR